MSNPTVVFLILLLVAFATGSLPFGLWIARMRGIDIKRVGSGNIGFTNVWRSVGRPEGIVTLIGDVLKGALPPVVLVRFLPESASTFSPSTAALLFGLAAILGHCFSPFVNFRGGKGVATSLGVFLVLTPVAIGISILVFIVAVATTRFISLGSILAAIVLPLVVAIRQGVTPLFFVAMCVGILVLVRHRENVVRLIRGTESKFSFGGKKS